MGVTEKRGKQQLAAAELLGAHKGASPWLPAALTARFVQFAWPGNIRQLRNMTRQLVIGSRGRPVPGIRTAADLRAEEIERCFRECGGDLDAMVQRLAVSGRALKRRLRELGLEPGATSGRG